MHTLVLLQKQVYVRVLVGNPYVTVPEGGNAGIQVSLSAAPTAAVTVTAVRVEGDMDITCGTTLTFTPASWNIPQTMTFASPAAAESAVTFDRDGIYILRATVSDGRGGVVSSDVSITVYRQLAPDRASRIYRHNRATNQINLAWIDQTTNATGYVVDRSLDNTIWVPVLPRET
ncbi:MAG: hypothetical protein WCR06_05430 [bacterium]